MSITSITIRLDIGDGNSSTMAGGVSLDGQAPSPMSFASGTATMSQEDAPTPSTSIALSSDQDTAPTPMSGAGGMAVLISEPPAPSADMANTGSAASGDQTPPEPEGEPVGAKKAPAKR